MTENFDETVEVKNIDGRDVEVHTKGQNWFDCAVGTNGYHGGDSGHGGRAYFRLGNIDCDDFVVNEIYKKDMYNNKTLTGIEFQMDGDLEIRSFIKSLEYAVSVLKSQVGNEQNN